jgi:Family of unknown function (DUF6788)
MNLKERDLRSRLLQLASVTGILHGTLNTRARTCGKANCKCARGEKHVSLYLMITKDGQTRHLFVPPPYVDRVRQWVENYQQVLALLDEISDVYWTKIQEREE